MRAVQERFETSERTACRWLDVNRKLLHREPRQPLDEPLRSWLIAKAERHRRYGQRRMVVLARREGFTDNHKRIERIYRGAALQVRKRVRRKLALGRGPITERHGNLGEARRAVRRGRRAARCALGQEVLQSL